MAKRLTREEKRNQAVIDLINQMFIMAGHQVTYDDIKDRQDAWYTEWTMTMQEYEDWKVWGKKYLIKNLRLNAKIAEREMLWVGVQWGLKCRDYESYIEKQNEQSI
tara:strand:- start:425 stop:742 length:318 start_codon:yes stop_codon:yes gene_type:complete